MSKKIAVINDLSGFGRCSLTAAISVISAMGVQPCPLPTAILTAQTGYPDYYCDLWPANGRSSRSSVSSIPSAPRKIFSWWIL